jgi:hypothetical protein
MRTRVAFALGALLCSVLAGCNRPPDLSDIPPPKPPPGYSAPPSTPNAAGTPNAPTPPAPEKTKK